MMLAYKNKNSLKHDRIRGKKVLIFKNYLNLV